MTRPSPSPLFALAVAMAATMALGACSKAKDTTSGATGRVITTVVGPPSTTAAAGSGSSPASTLPTTASPAPAGTSAVRDWDGTRFDIGRLDRIDRTEDGKTLVVFDRMQLDQGTGLKSGKDLTAEPIVYGNTDMPLVNDTTRLRTYVATPGMEVLRLANARETCVDLMTPRPPRWEPATVDQVVDQSLWKDYPQVSLTFSTDGFVSRLRLSTGC
jgi:hypothetical protein